MTTRRKQVLKSWLKSNFSAKSVASELGLSPKTVEYHLAAAKLFPGESLYAVAIRASKLEL
jgi:DNA-binding CsgD family transcriptional regulator